MNREDKTTAETSVLVTRTTSSTVVWPAGTFAHFIPQHDTARDDSGHRERRVHTEAEFLREGLLNLDRSRRIFCLVGQIKYLGVSGIAQARRGDHADPFAPQIPGAQFGDVVSRLRART